MNLLKYGLAFIIADTLIGQINWQPFPIDAWDLYCIQLLTQSAMLAFVVFLLVPFKYLGAKTLAFAFFLSEVFEAASYFTNELYYQILGAHFLFFAIWTGYAACRSYYITGVADPLVSKIYKVTHKPDCPTDFLLSLVGKDAVGGSGVYYEGVLYAFHRGEFKRYERIPAGAIFIEADIEIDHTGIRNYLDDKLGTKWSLTNNCVTLWWGINHA